MRSLKDWVFNIRQDENLRQQVKSLRSELSRTQMKHDGMVSALRRTDADNSELRKLASDRNQMKLQRDRIAAYLAATGETDVDAEGRDYLASACREAQRETLNSLSRVLLKTIETGLNNYTLTAVLLFVLRHQQMLNDEDRKYLDRRKKIDRE